MLGRFEEAVLLALIDAKDELAIAEIPDKMKRESSFGAIYTTLDRMGEKKFITRRKEPPCLSEAARLGTIIKSPILAALLLSKHSKQWPHGRIASAWRGAKMRGKNNSDMSIPPVNELPSPEEEHDLAETLRLLVEKGRKGAINLKREGRGRSIKVSG
jgi:hypothetical protein